MTEPDVVIVGGGHNGLVAAAYLARAGRRVQLLERLDHVGGAAVSAHAFDGIDARLSRYSYLVSLLPRRIVDDLGARVRLVRRRYSSYTPDPATAGRDTVELPYTAHIFWARPRAVPAGPSTGIVLSLNTSPGGVPKRPLGRGRIGLRGVDGDRHRQPEPIHGTPAQAICLLAFEAIERIRADGHQSFPGAYGENLTLAGFDWQGLRHGDRMRIGEEGPLLELTDYATPCATQEQWFLGGRTGRISSRKHPEDARWYARVVEEGDVAAGDTVRLTRTA